MASEGDREDTPLGPGLTQQQTMLSGFSASPVVITLQLIDAQKTLGDWGLCGLSQRCHSFAEPQAKEGTRLSGKDVSNYVMVAGRIH